MKHSDIAEKLGCTLRGDGNTEITGVSGIKEAESGQHISAPPPSTPARG
ncbi:MAG: hypothetical protein ACREUD_01460 [Gammaproteobacteria bacterium]